MENLKESDIKNIMEKLKNINDVIEECTLIEGFTDELKGYIYHLVEFKKILEKFNANDVEEFGEEFKKELDKIKEFTTKGLEEVGELKKQLDKVEVLMEELKEKIIINKEDILMLSQLIFLTLVLFFVFYFKFF
jgi:antirestriction protein